MSRSVGKIQRLEDWDAKRLRVGICDPNSLRNEIHDISEISDCGRSIFELLPKRPVSELFFIFCIKLSMRVDGKKIEVVVCFQEV